MLLLYTFDTFWVKKNEMYGSELSRLAAIVGWFILMNVIYREKDKKILVVVFVIYPFSFSFFC